MCVQFLIIRESYFIFFLGHSVIEAISYCGHHLVSLENRFLPSVETSECDCKLYFSKRSKNTISSFLNVY